MNLRRWAIRLAGMAGAVGVSVWLVACAADPPPPSFGTGPAPKEGEAAPIVILVLEGWHSGIVVARAELPDGLIPEAADFPMADYLEFGWGDREYYPTRSPPIGTLLAAAFVPTASTIRISGLPGVPAAAPGREAYRLRIGKDGFRHMLAAIDAAFDRSGGERAEVVAPGRDGDDLFYAAHGRFHLLNTCNTWVARKLAIAGLAISASGVVSVDDLRSRLETLPDPVVQSPGSAAPASVWRTPVWSASTASNRAPRT